MRNCYDGMARTPGRQSDEPEDEAMLAADEVNFEEVHRVLTDMADQLRAVAGRIKSPSIESCLEYDEQIGMDEAEHEKLNREYRDALERTLTGLRQFRRNYDYWERAIAEYLLAHQGFTQRDTARLLGVGVSTINRWAQNPLQVQDYR